MDDKEVDVFLEETQVLLEMESEERNRYVRESLEWIGEVAEYVRGADGKIQMSKRMKEVDQMFKEKGKEIIVCLLWAIKTEYRNDVLRLLGKLVGMEEVLQET